MSRSVIEAGKGGWVRALPIAANVAVYVRFEQRKGRLVAADLFLQPLDGGEVTSDLMRVGFGEIDRAVRSGDLARRVLARIDEPGPDLRRAAMAFSDEALDDLERTWVNDMLDAQVPGSGVPQLRYQSPRRRGDENHIDVAEFAAARCVIEVPPKPRPDEFYRAVAAAYELLVPLTDRPAVFLADVNREKIENVRKWIHEARKRGFLPPGRVGRAG